MPPEETVILKYLIHHLGPDFRLDIGHQHRFGHKLLIQPMLQTFLRIAPVVVDPQTQRERPPVVGRMPYCIIWLNLHGILNLRHHIGGDFLSINSVYCNFFQTGIQHIVGRDPAGRGATASYKGEQHRDYQ